MSLVLAGHPTCRDIVELVTEYDEGGLSDEDRVHLEEHLAICVGCLTYREQLYQVGDLVRAVAGAHDGAVDAATAAATDAATDDAIDPATEATLLAALRAGWGPR